MSSEPSGILPWKSVFKLLGAQLGVILVVCLISGASVGLVGSLLVVILLMSISLVKPLFSEEVEHYEQDLDSMKSDLQRKSDALAREREEIEVLMAAIPEPVVAVDQNMRVLFYNSRFAVLFGDWKGESKQPLLGEIFRTPEILDVFRNSLRDGKNTGVSAELRTLSEQQSRFFSLSVTPLRREASIPAYAAVGILHDVTELKRAEKIRIDFVANVSHELRTPLTAIKGYTDTLALDIRNQQYDAVDKYIQVINRNTDRLMSLIEDLLDLSSLESGGEHGESSDQSHLATVNTREVSARIVSQLEPRRELKHHTIETVFETDYVQADPRRLEQVLTNLIDNAIKYVPQGGKIKVHWQRGDHAVVLRVTDNGPGIPPKYQTRLFERFFRIDKARSREMGGTGLGLAIVKHIMQKHGGSVRVESELGKGTEFICEFPEGKTNAVLTQS